MLAHWCIRNSGRPVLRNVKFGVQARCLIFFPTSIYLYRIGFRVGSTAELCFLTQFSHCSCRSEPIFLYCSMLWIGARYGASHKKGTSNTRRGSADGCSNETISFCACTHVSQPTYRKLNIDNREIRPEPPVLKGCIRIRVCRGCTIKVLAILRALRSQSLQCTLNMIRTGTKYSYDTHTVVGWHRTAVIQVLFYTTLYGNMMTVCILICSPNSPYTRDRVDTTHSTLYINKYLRTVR